MADNEQAPGIGDNGCDEASFLSHVNALAKIDFDLKALKDRRSKARKAAKADGIVLGDLDAAVKMAMWEIEDVQGHFARRQAYLRWLKVPIGGQFELELDAADPIEDEDEADEARAAKLIAAAFDDGWRCAMLNGHPKDSPHSAETPAGQKWLEGYHEGSKRLAAEQSEPSDDDTLDAA